eukprot:TRINITY_DN8792_c0_g1_i3.p2 TRINITY_DN8792_c0_g1~~TRINITY_DN8792_c0_g1_i3.p2  ORF type:complete len:107 (-),score=15.33 TRINITY_DN8792_c0_g1_i3:405-725(-)
MILQTFRRERRVAKVSKKLKCTKKSLRKEKLLTLTLTEYKVQRFVSFILSKGCSANDQDNIGKRHGHGYSETSSFTEPRRIFAMVKVSREGAGASGVGERAKLTKS